MRKLAALTLLLALVLAACGGGGGETASEEETTAAATEEDTAGAEEPSAEESAAAGSEFTPLNEGVLTVGTELPAPPFYIGDDYAAITGGYEYDLAGEIAAKLGIDAVEIVEMPFTGLVAGQECPCDFALSQVTITDERAEVVDFSSPYFDANQGVLVQPGTAVGSLDEARGLQWGVQLNTTGLEFLASTVQPETEPQVYNTVVDMFTALRAGQIDAAMMDTPIVLGEAARPDSGLEVVGQFETGEQYGAVLAKDSPNTEALDAVLEELEAEGVFDALGEEYFNDPASVPVLE